MLQHLTTPAELRRQTARVEASLCRLSTTIEKRKAVVQAERKQVEDEKLKLLGTPWWQQ